MPGWYDPTMYDRAEWRQRIPPNTVGGDDGSLLHTRFNETRYGGSVGGLPGLRLHPPYIDCE